MNKFIAQNTKCDQNNRYGLYKRYFFVKNKAYTSRHASSAVPDKKPLLAYNFPICCYTEEMNHSDTCSIALLRGINVGGHTVKMERLREIFIQLGLLRVRSYIQSGNIFFDSPKKTDRTMLQKRIEAQLHDSLGYRVAVCLRSKEEMEQLVSSDPFSGRVSTPETRFAVTFLAEPVTPLPFSVPFTTPDGAYELIGMTPTELFIIWHLKNGRPGNAYGFFEKQIQTQTTTRFWHTVEKILTAAKTT